MTQYISYSIDSIVETNTHANTHISRLLTLYHSNTIQHHVFTLYHCQHTITLIINVSTQTCDVIDQGQFVSTTTLTSMLPLYLHPTHTPMLPTHTTNFELTSCYALCITYIITFSLTLLHIRNYI